MVYMRRTIIPSLLQVIKENQDYETMSIFEFANIYEKNEKDLPIQITKIAGLVKKQHVSFPHVKGIVEQVLSDLGISGLTFKQSEHTYGAMSLLIKANLGILKYLRNQLSLLNLILRQSCNTQLLRNIINRLVNIRQS